MRHTVIHSQCGPHSTLPFDSQLLTNVLETHCGMFLWPSECEGRSRGPWPGPGPICSRRRCSSCQPAGQRSRSYSCSRCVSPGKPRSTAHKVKAKCNHTRTTERAFLIWFLFHSDYGRVYRLTLPRIHTEAGRKRLNYNTARAYNSLPFAPHPTAFRPQLKKYLLAKRHIPD